MKVKELPIPYTTSAQCRDCGALLEVDQDDLSYKNFPNCRTVVTAHFFFVCGHCGYEQHCDSLPEYVRRIVWRKLGLEFDG